MNKSKYMSELAKKGHLKRAKESYFFKNKLNAKEAGKLGAAKRWEKKNAEKPQEATETTEK